MKNLIYFQLISGIFIYSCFTRVEAQPQVSDPALQLQQLGNINDYAVRIARNPMDNKLYYCTFFGDIYRLDVAGGVYNGVLVAGEPNHHINFLQGMLFKDSALYISGNRKQSGASGYGLLVRGKWQQGGGWLWDTIMHTANYPSTATLYDHAFSSLCLSADGNFIFVGSGSRTDHGEIQTSNGLYPGKRDAPLTSTIFKLPLNPAQTILLPNDSNQLMASGYVYARGVRNTFDMAIAPNKDLIGSENSGDRDDSDELNWIRSGFHYGFPWKMGGNLTGQQFPGYVPANDKLINHNCLGWTNVPPYFYNDPTYPAMPGGLSYAEPIRNYGPDADKSRDAVDGHIHDASNEATYITSFTSHRSPLGLAFDTSGLLAAPYGYSGFVMSYTKGTADTTGTVNGGIGPFSDVGQDLLHLCLNKDTATGIYSMNAYRIAWNFDRPVDSWLEGNQLYIIETHEPGDPQPARLYRLTFPADTIVNSMGFLPADTTTCQGSQVTITPNLKGSFTYLWSNGATTKQITVTPSVTKKYWLRIYNGIITITDTIKIKINPAPSTFITPLGPTAFCNGGSVVLSVGLEDFRAYQWRKNSIDIQGAISDTYTVQSKGTYKVKVTNQLTGCTKVTVTGVPVTVFPKPQAVVNPPGPVSFCTGDSVVLHANTGSLLTYVWKKNGNVILNAFSSDYTAKTAGNYRVQVTDANNCSKQSENVSVTVPCRMNPGTGNEQTETTLVCYPNPSDGDFIFEWSSAEAGNPEIHIYDMTGRAIAFSLTRLADNMARITLPYPGAFMAELVNSISRSRMIIVRTR